MRNLLALGALLSIAFPLAACEDEPVSNDSVVYCADGSVKQDNVACPRRSPDDVDNDRDPNTHTP